jgi:hypothetical protein
MRQQRILAEDVWCNMRTALNIGEPLFQFSWAKTPFSRVLHNANGIFGFEIRGLKLDGASLSFYGQARQRLGTATDYAVD